MGVLEISRDFLGIGLILWGVNGIFIGLHGDFIGLSGDLYGFCQVENQSFVDHFPREPIVFPHLC